MLVSVQASFKFFYLHKIKVFHNKLKSRLKVARNEANLEGFIMRD